MLRIDAEEVKRRLDTGARVLFIDARSANAYAAAGSSSLGSMRIPPDQADALAGAVPKGDLLVSYCT